MEVQSTGYSRLQFHVDCLVVIGRPAGEAERRLEAQGMAFFKALFHRPLTYNELLKDVGKLITSPPLPADWKRLAAGWVGKNGTSLLDHWRDYFKSQLEMIAEEATWQMQRSRPPEADHDGAQLARCARDLAGRQTRRIMVFLVQRRTLGEGREREKLALAANAALANGGPLRRMPDYSRHDVLRPGLK